MSFKIFNSMSSWVSFLRDLKKQNNLCTFTVRVPSGLHHGRKRILHRWYFWWLLTSWRWEEYVKSWSIQAQWVSGRFSVKSHLVSVSTPRRLRLIPLPQITNPCSISFSGGIQRPDVRLITGIWSICENLNTIIIKWSLQMATIQIWSHLLTMQLTPGVNKIQGYTSVRFNIFRFWSRKIFNIKVSKPPFKLWGFVSDCKATRGFSHLRYQFMAFSFRVFFFYTFK